MAAAFAVHGVTGVKILQVNTADRGGGAEGSARALFEAYRRRGHCSWLAVGRKLSADPAVFEIPRTAAPSATGRLLQRLAQRLRQAPARRLWAAGLARRLEILADPLRRGLARGLGFNPRHRTALDLCPEPDIVHCHNLHGGYFDLRAARSSHRVPLILNLRDTWLLAGHCGSAMVRPLAPRHGQCYDSALPVAAGRHGRELAAQSGCLRRQPPSHHGPVRMAARVRPRVHAHGGELPHDPQRHRPRRLPSG